MELWCVQVTGYRRGSKLVACFQSQSRLVVLNLDNNEQKGVVIQGSTLWAASQDYLAVTPFGEDMRILTHDGDLVHIVPDSNEANSASFDAQTYGILGVGFKDGSMRMWDVRVQALVFLLKQTEKYVSCVRFSPGGRIFLSSGVGTASIVTLDDQYQVVSQVLLQGHSLWVNDILPLPSSNQCVTCSTDTTIKVWDCQTAACIRTLSEHADSVRSLALHPNGYSFASGSLDRFVIIWSSETFEALHRLEFPDWVQAIRFGDGNMLYVGVYNHGVLSCNARTGEVGPILISGSGNTTGLAYST
jgi:WD40 repeat protein